MVAKTARHNKIPETGFQFSRAQKQEQLSYVGLGYILSDSRDDYNKVRRSGDQEGGALLECWPIL